MFPLASTPRLSRPRRNIDAGGELKSAPALGGPPDEDQILYPGSRLYVVSPRARRLAKNLRARCELARSGAMDVQGLTRLSRAEIKEIEQSVAAVERGEVGDDFPVTLLRTNNPSRLHIERTENARAGLRGAIEILERRPQTEPAHQRLNGRRARCQVGLFPD